MAQFVALALALVAVSGCALFSGEPRLPWDHIVVVVLENRSSSQVRDLPQLARLRSLGREYVNSYGVTRPSQPNYIALFSGGTQGIADNQTHTVDAPNLYTALADRGFRMLTYAQGLPSPGFRGDAYPYLRKHNPAASFSNVPDAAIVSLAEFPTGHWDDLPELSLIIPDMVHGMHDGTTPALAAEAADTWLLDQVVPFATWAQTHRSLLVVTFDEPDTSLGADVTSAPILTFFVGQGVDSGVSDQRLTHYTVHGFFLDSFGAPRLGLAVGEPKL